MAPEVVGSNPAVTHPNLLRAGLRLVAFLALVFLATVGTASAYEHDKLHQTIAENRAKSQAKRAG